MFRWLVGALAWVVSVVVRLAFVLAVVGLAAGFALGSSPPDVTNASDHVVDAASDLVPFDLDDIGTVGVSGVEDGDVGSNPLNRSPVPSSNSPELNGTRLERLVHRGINERRAAHGRPNLSFETGLRSVARYHSADMANRRYFSHVGPDGETLTDRYEKFGYRCRVPMSGFRFATGGENILYTYYDTPVRMGNRTVRYTSEAELARAIVNGWMNSTEHRENLLEPYWNNEGIGVRFERVGGRTRVYASQEFC